MKEKGKGRLKAKETEGAAVLRSMTKGKPLLSQFEMMIEWINKMIDSSREEIKPLEVFFPLILSRP